MIDKLISKFQRNKWRNYLVAEYIGGHWFYTYKNVMYLHNRRQFLFQMALKESEYGISYTDLLACTNLVKNALQTNDIGKAYTYLNTLETYTSMMFNHKAIFKLCDAIILMDSEPELTKDEEWTLKKQKAFENNEEVKGFFFGTLQRTLMDLNKLSNDILIEDYMRREEVKRIESLFLNMITEKTSSTITPE